MMTMIMKVVTGDDDDDDDNNNNDNLETKNNHGRLSKNPVSSILL